jgi:hypothetical protein
MITTGSSAHYCVSISLLLMMTGGAAFIIDGFVLSSNLEGAGVLKTKLDCLREVGEEPSLRRAFSSIYSKVRVFFLIGLSSKPCTSGG